MKKLSFSTGLLIAFCAVVFYTDKYYNPSQNQPNQQTATLSAVSYNTSQVAGISIYCDPQTDKACFERNKKLAHERLMARMETQRDKIEAFANKYQKFRNWSRPLAIKKALATGWEGDTTDIEMFDPWTGDIVALKQANINAAILVENDDIKPGGTFWNVDNDDPTLNGSGMIVGVWDGGRVMRTHDQFNSGAFGQRVLYKDNDVSFRSFHATHVAGTIGGDGLFEGQGQANAQGMATQVMIHSYHKAQLFSEIPLAMLNDGLIISNHSTSNPRGLYTSSGQWTAKSTYPYSADHGFRNYDAACYWLDDAIHTSKSAVFVAASNSQLSNGEVAAITGGNIRYRDIDDNWQIVPYANFPVNTQQGNTGTIPSYSNAKNVFTVGSASAKNVIEYYSNKGPSGAGGSIKPDAVADGSNLYSADYVSGSEVTSNYATYSGTSMATPTASGTATLLLEYYAGLNGAYPTDPGAFLRGLMKHTTQDAYTDGAGPTYTDGYGLISGRNGADVIKKDFNGQAGARIAEATLQQGEQHVYKVTSTGSARVMVSICWTDPASVPSTGDINDYDPQATGDNDPGGDEIDQGGSNLEDFAKRYFVIDNWLQPRIVNDLTLRGNRLSNNTISYPYVLDPNNPNNAATQSDNFRDPFELISIANPGGGVTYTFTVSHKGTLSGGSQPYTIIFSGVNQNLEVKSLVQYKGYPTQQITFNNGDFEDDQGNPLNISSVGVGTDYSVSGNTITINGPAAGGWLTVPITFQGGNTINANVQVVPVNVAPSFTVADQSGTGYVVDSTSPTTATLTIDEDTDVINISAFASAISNGNANSNQTVQFQFSGVDNNFYTVNPFISTAGNLFFVIEGSNWSGTDQVQITLVDNGETGGPHQNTSAVFTLDIIMTPINDPPSFTGGGDVNRDPGDGAVSIANWATAISDGDPEPGTVQTLTFNVTGNTNPGLFSVQPAIASNGTLSFTLNGTTGTTTLTVNLSDNGAPVETSANYVFDIDVGDVLLVINEIGAYPGGNGCTFVGCTEVDASGETTFSGTSDEFIELINVQDVSLDLTGWSIRVAGAIEYTFGATVLAPNQAVVVFGTSAVPAASIYTNVGVIALVAPTLNATGLGLVNGGALVEILDNSAAVHTSYTYGNQTRSISTTRSPDLTGSFADSNHPTINSSPWQRRIITNAIGPVYSNDNNAQISPGRRTDGTSFLNQAPTFTIPAPIVYTKPNSGTRTMNSFITNMNDGDVHYTQGFTQFNVSNNNNALFVEQPAISVDGTLTFKVANEVTGTATVTVTLQDDGSGISPNVNTSTAQQFTITITSSVVVLNEVMAWPAGGTSSDPTINSNGVDENNVADITLGQGVAQFDADEFIELYNWSDQTVNIGGYTLRDDAGLAVDIIHTFPDPTNIAPGQSVVVFGKGSPAENPSAPYFAESLVVTNNNGQSDLGTSGAGLTNAGNTVYLVNGVLNGSPVIDQITYTQQTRSFSMTRLPDITGGWTTHPTNDAWTNSAGSAGNISPGRAVDNSVFTDNGDPSFDPGGSVFVFENTGAHVISAWATNIDDGDSELSENLSFEINTLPSTLFSVQPTINAGTGNLTFTLDANQTGTVVLSVVLRDAADNVSATEELRITVVPENTSTLVFNEFMTWPAGDGTNAGTAPVINSNGLGSADYRYDEFIEMVNIGNTSLDISGWQITDDEAGTVVIHTFPGSTILNPGQAIVVFGNDPGGAPNVAAFGGALVQESSVGTNMGLDNNGDLGIYIKNGGTVIDKFYYEGYGTNIRSVSFTRSPDVTGPYTHHPDNPTLLNADNNNQPSNISPGRKYNGESFSGQSAGAANWTMNWDNTNLYINVKVTSLAHAPVVYIDADPLPIINGGTNANGSLSGQAYDNITFNPAFRADYMVYFKQGTLEQRTDNGAGGWNAGNNTNLNYNANGTTHTLTIPWANITGGSKPVSFAWAGYVGYVSGGNNLYGSLPADNSDDITGQGGAIPVNATWYYIINNTNVAEDPFAKNSYVSRATGNLATTEAYNITVSTGHTITLTGNWNVAGDLLIAGTLVAGSNTITIAGDLINQGILTANTSTVSFTGSNPATVTGATTFNNLQINNSGGVTLNDPVTITGQLRLVNGVLTTTSVNLLTLNDGATTSALTSDSYVDGPLKKIGDDPFIFPVGNAGVFAPIATEALANTNATDAFTAQYFRSAAPNGDQISGDAPNFITKVSAIEYWDLDRTVGSPNAQVRLYFNSLSASDIQNTSTMRVGHYTGGQWQDEGGFWTNGVTANTGSVLSANVLTTFSPMAPASDDSNGLPIELLSFSGAYENNAVELKWETASEENVASFELLRSANGTDFELLTTVVATNQINGAHYTHTDRVPFSGVSYYQLRSVDKDGTVSSYSRVVQVEVPVALGITVYPNPVDPETTQVSVLLAGIEFSQNQTAVTIYDAFGRQVLYQTTDIDTERKQVQVDIPSTLVSGIYLLRFDIPNTPAIKLQINR